MSIPSGNTISTLANYIVEMKNDGVSPILLLGAGCSVSSGCPSSKKLISDLIDKNNLELNPNECDLSDIEKMLQDRIFNLNLKNYFSNSKPSYGYWALAELIKKGYFSLILTTNYDTCLEKTLAKVMSVDKYRVMVRGDIEDKRIIGLLDNPDPKVKIIKLHGDYLSRNMIVQYNQIWEFDNGLSIKFCELINKSGIIFIGTSLQEIGIIKSLPKLSELRKNSWWISKDEQPPDKKSQIKIDKIISGELGDFDNFTLGLSKKIIEIEQNKPESITQKLKQNLSQSLNFDKLLSSINPLMDISTLRRKVGKFQRILSKTCQGRNNLIFIHDPDCPGGTEVYKILERDFKSWLDSQEVFKMEIIGRENNLYNRIAKEPQRMNGLPVILSSVDTALPFILIDSVSFTGGTIEKCKEKLEATFTKDISIFAAVLFSGPAQEKKLESDKFCIGSQFFIKLETINSYFINFPWGYTSSTKPVEAYSKDSGDFIDIFLPSHRFSFLPRPWGKISSLVENDNVSVKLLYLNPRQRTSKHKHFFRDEIFCILHEYMTLQIFDHHVPLKKGDFFCVPAGIEHRHIALDAPCWILEISYNYCDQINDIIRLEDNYGRDPENGSE